MPKRILIVSPGQKGISWATTHPPMNIGYIASYLLKYGHKVLIIDELAGQNLNRAIKKFNPDIVGVTATTPFVPYAYEVADISRRYGILSVIGGVHATVLPQEALLYFDIVVIGEGERAMVDIANGDYSKGIKKASYIKDIDEIPPPAWHLMDMDFYLTSPYRNRRTHLRFVSPHTRIASYISSRGCPFSCIFCYNSWYGLPMRFHSPKRVIEDIKYLIEKYHIQALYFMDDNLFANRPRLIEICELMHKAKINIVWGCQATSNYIDSGLLKIVKEAGCRQIGFGFESGSQRILDILKEEKQTVQCNARAVELCREVGILPYATFMIGNPTETMDEIKETFEFIKDNRMTDIGIHITTPYPGTKLWQWSKEHNLLSTDIDWRTFTTGRVSILACDTIQGEIIEELARKMNLFFNPLTLRDVVNIVWGRPHSIFKWIRHPLKLAALFKRSKSIGNW